MPQSVQVSVKAISASKCKVGSPPCSPCLPCLPCLLLSWHRGGTGLQAPHSLPWGVFRDLWVGKGCQPLRGIEIINPFLAEGKVGKKYIHEEFPSLLDEDVDFRRLAKPW